MKLFKVSIEFETVIRAASAEDAEQIAERTIKESDDPASFIASTELNSVDELPPGWNEHCRAWGERDDFDRTVGQILSSVKPDLPCDGR